MGEKKRIEMKGRDLEGLLFLGRIRTVNLEYCSEDKTMARVVAALDTGEEVSTFCIPTRAAGKINTVIKHYLRMGISKYFVTESVEGVENIDEGEEEGGTNT